MELPEFMQMKLSKLPPEFFKLYNLDTIADNNGTMYIKVQKGMYGLPQAGILAQQLLKRERIPPKSHHIRTMEARHLPYIIHALR